MVLCHGKEAYSAAVLRVSALVPELNAAYHENCPTVMLRL